MTEDYVMYDTSKALWHLDKLLKLRNKQSFAPAVIQVDLEAYCNDSCVFCAYRKPDGYNNTMLKLIDAIPGETYSKNRPIGKPTEAGSLGQKFAYELPRMMVEAGIPAVEITGGGEPTLWRGFDDLISNLMSEGREIGLVTNGSTLPESRVKLLAKACKWIRFSFDSAEATTHRNVHGTANFDFERRLESLKLLIAERNSLGRRPSEKDEGLVIGISFIITPLNIQDLEAAASLFHSLGVDHIRFSWMFDKQGTAGLTAIQIDQVKTRLSMIKSRENSDSFKVIYESGRIDTYSKPNTDFDYCYMQHFVWAIGADGNVYPCCIMKYHPNFAWGNINDNSLKEMAENPQIFAKMQALDPKQCFPCWLRPRNMHIGKAFKKPMHANFV